MRRTIAIPWRPKGKPEELRLYRMNDQQAELFESVTVQLAAVEQTTVLAASEKVERVVIEMIGGAMPKDGSPQVFYRMRLTFPVLGPRAMKQLPIFGCPTGSVYKILLQLQNEEKKRTVCIGFTVEQAEFYNDALDEVQARDHVTRDEAWRCLNALVGNLIVGAVPDPGSDPLVLKAATLWEALDPEEAMQLPLATESDVRRWSCRDAP